MTYKIISLIILFIYPALVYSDDFKLNRNQKNYSDVQIGSDYFPIDPSLKLTYNSSMGEAYSSVEKASDDYILNLQNDDFFFIQTIYMQNDTVYLTKLDQEVDILLFISAGSTVTYGTPYLRFPFPMQSNQTWSWSGVEFIGDKEPDSITVIGKVIGQEILETEAGSFECIKFQIDIRKKRTGTHTKFYEWRTPGIGLVKLEAYIDAKGFIGSIMSMLGYDEMKFELKKIG